VARDWFKVVAAVHLFLLAWFDLDRLPENVIPYVRRALENYRRARWFDSFGWE
jgi:hypothetical protein